MAKLPDLEQLPSYTDAGKSVRRLSRQCIWFQPGTGRNCTIDITFEDMKHVFRYMREIQKAESRSLVAEALLQIIKHMCCDQLHRDLVHNSGINKKLASKWQEELFVHASDATGNDRLSHKSNLDRKSTLRSASASINSKTTVNTESSGREGSHIKRLAAGDARLRTLLDKSRASETNSYFRPHVRQPDENVASKLMLRLGTKDIEARTDGKEGCIYLFTQKLFPGMVKIGYTYGRTQNRLAYWSKCGHGKPDLVRNFEQVPCARRLEVLVHFELVTFWRKERYCKQHTSTHVEWFEISTHEAERTAGLWVEWMKCAKPYDARGVLKESWRSMIQELKDQEIAVTAELLLALHNL